MALVSLLPHTDQQEKLALLSLFELMAKNDPSVLEASVSQLLAYLCPNTSSSSGTGCVCTGVLKVIYSISQRRPTLLIEHVATLQRASAPPHASSTHVILVAQILTEVGKLNKVSYAAKPTMKKLKICNICVIYVVGTCPRSVEFRS